MEKKNVDLGQDYYLKGCDNGFIPACHNAGLIFFSSKIGSVHDPARAVKLLKHACEQKYVTSCFQVKNYYILQVLWQKLILFHLPSHHISDFLC